MKRSTNGRDEGAQQDKRVRETRRAEPGSAQWIRTLSGDLLEPHPLVKELRQTLQARDAALADREREIARLQAALVFGLKKVPLKPDLLDRPPVG